jgi:hypothetical protein
LVILKQRLAMYRKLREEAQKSGTPAGHDAFYESYVRFVDLVNDAVLGGAVLQARSQVELRLRVVDVINGHSAVSASGLLYPDNQTFISGSPTSALGQTRTFDLSSNAGLCGRMKQWSLH